MALTNEQVEHIATLARLRLRDEEKPDFNARLSRVFEWVAQLQDVDVDGIEPMTHSIAIANVLREDEIEGSDSATRDALVGAFPEKEEDLLRVKSVF